MSEQRKCSDCGEATYNPERCRDCDIEWYLAMGTCRACLTWILRTEIAGPVRDQHADDCPLRNAEEYGPRTFDETQAVREGRKS